MPSPADDSAWAAALVALDPARIGGAILRSAAGPARDQWLARLAALLPSGTPLRRMPAHIDDERLLGGLDLAATLRAGHPVLRKGLLAEADGGVVVMAMAERATPAMAARVARVIDEEAVALHREGLTRLLPTRLGVVALDEGESDDECVPALLSERLAIHLRLPDRPDARAWPAFDIAAARARLARLQASDEIVTALCQAAQALGIVSVRAPWWALRVACGAAALRGSGEVQAEDAALSARLVLAPRARQWPAPPQAQQQTQTAADDPGDARHEQPPPPAADAAPQDAPSTSPPPPAGTALEDRVLQSALSALPADLLATLAAGGIERATVGAAGRRGAARDALSHGRPLGARRAELRGGARLDLLQTLRAAAPWQPLRRRDLGDRSSSPAAAVVLVRREDFHVRRYQQAAESTTIFAVDASGSQALNRLAEAKGAVELLLADCYVRRDRVALIAFRGAGAEVLLPPTRSLVRAKRSLQGLPGGGGTPLAAGIDSARGLAETVRRQGGTPLIVLLTDGRANVSRQGQGGRPQALTDALASARALRRAGLGVLLLDSAPQPGGPARTLAEAMGATYLALPHADAGTLANAVSTRRRQEQRFG
jgi:magnesium chelatase subunit D